MPKKPVVFVGDTTYKDFLKDIKKLGWGRIWVKSRPRPMPGEPWAMDNGAFLDYQAGRPFDEDLFRHRLKKAIKFATDERLPMVAVVPDIVGGGAASLDFSLKWLPKLPSDWPWFLAVQDGMELDAVARHLHRFAGIFFGGTIRFKFTAAMWCRLAHEHGKLFHYGRCGNSPRLNAAYMIGADSLDSSSPLWTRDKWEAFKRHWLELETRNTGTPVSLLDYL